MDDSHHDERQLPEKGPIYGLPWSVGNEEIKVQVFPLRIRIGTLIVARSQSVPDDLNIGLEDKATVNSDKAHADVERKIYIYG